MSRAHDFEPVGPDELADGCDLGPWCRCVDCDRQPVLVPTGARLVEDYGLGDPPF